MIQFQCDYTEGAHPLILEKMTETNLEQTVGYGNDPYCASARKRIQEACGRDDVDVHFLVGGTQANFTVISSILRPHQGAVAAVSGHINVHETGAVEATGHKVLALASEDGKITACQVREYYENTGMMQIMSILFSRVWYIFPIRQKMEHYIRRKSLKRSVRHAGSLHSHFSLTERGWGMV